MKSNPTSALVTKIKEKVQQLLLEGRFYKDYFFPANDWKFAKEIHEILRNQPTAYKDNIKEESSIVYFIQEYLSHIELREDEKWIEGKKTTRKIAEYYSGRI